VSVDTYLKGKNLSQYRTVRRDGIKVLLSPRLYGFADLIDLNLKGRLRPKLHAVINRAAGDC
jgi:hypothetical protein